MFAINLKKYRKYIHVLFLNQSTELRDHPVVSWVTEIPSACCQYVKDIMFSNA